jgi:hypothetical protein
VRSRADRDITSTYPELATAAGRRTIVIDGEIVAFDEGKPSFAALQRRMHILRPSPDLVAAPTRSGPSNSSKGLCWRRQLRAGKPGETGSVPVLNRGARHDPVARPASPAAARRHQFTPGRVGRGRAG